MAKQESTIIDRALEYVKKVFENDYSGHDYFHTLRVYKMATYIVTKLKRIREMAC